VQLLKWGMGEGGAEIVWKNKKNKNNKTKQKQIYLQYMNA
jgi:hypothetical protein